MKENTIIRDNQLENLFNLTSLNLTYNYRITDLGLSNLSNLTKLVLESSPSVTNDGLKRLTNLKKLVLSQYEHGNVQWHSTIDDSGLLELTNLTSLRLGPVPNISSKCLSKFRNLRKLSLVNNTTIGNYAIYNMTSLTKLTLKRTVDQVGMNYVGYGNEEISDKGLKKLTNLRSLISNSRLSDVGMKSLSLTSLNLEYASRVTDEGIKDMTSLTWLKLNENITLDGLKNLTNLTYLNVFRNLKLEPTDFAKNDFLPNLKTIIIYESQSI